MFLTISIIASIVCTHLSRGEREALNEFATVLRAEKRADRDIASTMGVLALCSMKDKEKRGTYAVHYCGLLFSDISAGSKSDICQLLEHLDYRRDTNLALRSILEEYLKKHYKEDVVQPRKWLGALGAGIVMDPRESAKHFLSELKKNDKQATSSMK